MKFVLNLLVLSLILTSAACAPSPSSNSGNSQPTLGAEKEFALSACPILKGRYVSADSHMEISEFKDATNYRIIIGEGADELTIDGKTNTTPHGTNYQGACTNGVLEIQLIIEGGKILMRLYFKENGQLVQEDIGSQSETLVWTKN